VTSAEDAIFAMNAILHECSAICLIWFTIQLTLTCDAMDAMDAMDAQ
jgi:fumarate reductase subunit C